MYEALAFRITAKYEDIKECISKVAEQSVALVVYEHNDTGRIHVHGYAEGLALSTDTFKNWIKKALNVKVFPKSDWAFSEVISKGERKGQKVDRESIVYFHKGKYPILFNKGIEESFILEQHSKSYIPKEYKPQEKTQFVLKYENPVEKKLREAQYLAEIKSHLKENPQPIDVIKAIKLVFNKYKVVLGRYKLRDYYDSVMRDVEPEGMWINRMMKICEPIV